MQAFGSNQFRNSLMKWCLKTNQFNSNTKMTNYNPYVNTLIEMGYDEQDCRNVAAAGDANVTYPRIIHGRTFETKEQYDDAVADFINGL